MSKCCFYCVYRHLVDTDIPLECSVDKHPIDDPYYDICEEFVPRMGKEEQDELDSI